MFHKKHLRDPETNEILATCNGRVLVDRLYPLDKRIELYCLMCGTRWFVKRDGTAFVEWLYARELTQNALASISS